MQKFLIFTFMHESASIISNRIYSYWHSSSFKQKLSLHGWKWYTYIVFCYSMLQRADIRTDCQYLKWPKSVKKYVLMIDLRNNNKILLLTHSWGPNFLNSSWHYNHVATWFSQDHFPLTIIHADIKLVSYASFVKITYVYEFRKWLGRNCRW